MNRNILYINRQNKAQPSGTKIRERLTKRNRLMVSDKKKINFSPQGHFFTHDFRITRPLIDAIYF